MRSSYTKWFKIIFLHLVIRFEYFSMSFLSFLLAAWSSFSTWCKTHGSRASGKLVSLDTKGGGSLNSLSGVLLFG